MESWIIMPYESGQSTPIKSDTDEHICDVATHHYGAGGEIVPIHEGEARVKLCAAAPDLLEACRQALLANEQSYVQPHKQGCPRAPRCY